MEKYRYFCRQIAICHKAYRHIAVPAGASCKTILLFKVGLYELFSHNIYQKGCLTIS